MADGLTPQEIDWIKRVLESTTALREKLLAHDTIEPKELYALCNRADALIWHLAKRDTLPEEVKQALGL